ncbi:MAG: LuxR C-terminal-related transcriptional regulator [Brevefilum sp.]|jgi:DNA-binding CsgD family transcriptional regulator
MTKVLIFKHPDSFGVMEVELPPERIVREINQGRWDRLMSDVEGPLYARVQGDIVVVTPSAPVPVDQLPKLSRREHQVLVLVGEGLTTAQIALKLGLRPRTIRGYVASMKARLDAQNIQQLVARAVALGLFHPDV